MWSPSHPVPYQPMCFALTILHLERTASPESPPQSLSFFGHPSVAAALHFLLVPSSLDGSPRPSNQARSAPLFPIIPTADQNGKRHHSHTVSLSSKTCETLRFGVYLQKVARLPHLRCMVKGVTLSLSAKCIKMRSVTIPQFPK